MKRTIRLKRRKKGMTGGGDGNGGSISNGNMTINRVWRKRVKDISILGEVGSGVAVEDRLRGG
jgi:hypothetical protein